MKKKLIVLAGAAMMLFQSCQESLTMNQVDETNGVNNEIIQFNNYVGGMTRASRGIGQSFFNADRMEVYGIQNAADGTTARVFNKQLVEYNGDVKWTYSPAKYWSKNSEYEFYAIFPYSASNSFSFDSKMFSVADFTVNDIADNQIDLMIAQRITNHQPYNVVNLIFNHILSSVNFYVKVAPEFNTTGVSQVVVTNFDVTGLYSKGSFAQTEWTSTQKANGTWTPDQTSVYDMPQVSDVVYTIGDETAQTLASDLLLLPQTMNNNAKITISFKLVYEDGSETIFDRTIKLKDIVGKKGTQSVSLAQWEPNSRYNYTISVNPSVTEFGGTHMPIGNADHDQDDYANMDPDNPFPLDINIIPVDTDGDNIPDEWWVDEDLDDEPDYPIIWKDIDGDGNLEALPDRDGDGQPDDSDGDGNPDVIWIDTDNDGILDTELEIVPTKPTDPNLPVDPNDPNYPTEPYVDYDGGASGGYMTPNAWIVLDEDGEYWFDTDHDGQGDIHILWKDIDGDGLLEGIADKNGDGKITPEDSYDNDGKDYLGNDNDYDVALYLGTDDNGDPVWKELEKEPAIPVIPEVKNVIEFTATVQDWEEEYEANYSF